MRRDSSLDRWDEFAGLAARGDLGKSLKDKMFFIPAGEKRILLGKVTKAAAKAGQIVRDNAHQFLGKFETVREIGQRAFLFGWMTDDEIDTLIKEGGWKEKN